VANDHEPLVHGATVHVIAASGQSPPAGALAPRAGRTRASSPRARLPARRGQLGVGAQVVTGDVVTEVMR
jgi:hypothetical protein